MNLLRIAKNPYIRLLINISYAIGNCVAGFLTQSWWFITVGAYYAVLAATRFSVLKINRKAGGDTGLEQYARRITGILLIVLSFCLIGMNILCALKDRGTVFHEIVMIAIAVYTFAKITLAITGMARAKRSASAVQQTLRNIALADAFVSIYTLQRSMVVSFPGMAQGEILMLNLMTGTAVWLMVLLLGLNLIGGKYINMAKSKIAKTAKQAADTVTVGYKKAEKGIVGGYRKIENAVIGSYTKIEDKFVKDFLIKDGETLEEAKDRLKKRNEK